MSCGRRTTITTTIISSCFLVITVMSIQSTVDAQTGAPQATAQPTIVPTPTLTLEQRISALEQSVQVARLDNLEKQVGNLNSTTDDWLNNVFELLKVVFQYFWPFIIILSIALFKDNIRNILGVLSSRIGNTRIKLKDFEWDPEDLDAVILEREILKVLITIATIDEHYDETELKHLGIVAKSMKERAMRLPDDDKREILMTGIQMALADGSFRSEEYIALKVKAQLYNLQSFNLDKAIREECSVAGIPLPPQLQTSSDT